MLHSTPLNRFVSNLGWRPAKRSESHVCVSLRTLTAKIRPTLIIFSVLVSLVRLTRMLIGEIEMEQNALQVIPCILLPARVVTIATPVANRDITFLNCSVFGDKSIICIGIVSDCRACRIGVQESLSVSRIEVSEPHGLGPKTATTSQSHVNDGSYSGTGIVVSTTRITSAGVTQTPKCRFISGNTKVYSSHIDPATLRGTTKLSSITFTGVNSARVPTSATTTA